MSILNYDISIYFIIYFEWKVFSSIRTKIELGAKIFEQVKYFK